jgi:hypothetical protein
VPSTVSCGFWCKKIAEFGVNCFVTCCEYNPCSTFLYYCLFHYVYVMYSYICVCRSS